MKSVRLAVALLAAVVLPLLVPSGATAQGIDKPVVDVVSRPGPVDIHTQDTFGTIATLHLDRGAWAILAKAQVVNTSTGAGVAYRMVTCRVVAGSDSAHAQVVPLTSTFPGSTEVVVAQVVHRFTSDGVARFQCAAHAPAGQMQAKFVRMSAVEAGHVTQATFGGGVVTSGSGRPQIVTGRLPGTAIVRHNGGDVTVASLPLPAGSWFVTATAEVASAANQLNDFTCDLRAEGDFDRAAGQLDSAGQVGDRLPFLATVVHTFGGAGSADLACSTSFDHSVIHVSSIVITAVRAGRLTNQPIGSSGSTTGTGIPRIISGYLDGPTPLPGHGTFSTVGSIDLPAGNWNVVAKLFLTNQHTATTHRTPVVCRLRPGTAAGDEADAHLADVSVIGAIQPLAMVDQARFSSTSPVAVRCASPGPTGDVVVSFLKITAMKAGTLRSG